ncbi:MAG: hypothetical protein AAF658_22460, partial [Myxococcota bacterium]
DALNRAPPSGLPTPGAAGVRGPSAPPSDLGIPLPAAAGARQLPDGIDPFSPPGDGKLTVEHITMFTEVARAARRTASGRIDDLRMQWAEARAAESLGYDPKGYRWAHARIHLALVQGKRREQLETTLAMREKMMAEVEKLRAEAKSDNERALIDAELENMVGVSALQLPEETAAERHNRLLVRTHTDALRNAIGLGAERLGPKLQVIEDPPAGDSGTPPVEGADEDEMLVPFNGTVGSSAESPPVEAPETP